MVWAIFIGYEVLFLYFTAGSMPPLLYFVAFYSVNMGLFYFVAHVVLEYAFFKCRRPFLNAVLLILGTLPLYLIIKNMIDTLVVSPFDPGHFKRNISKAYLVNNTWRGIYFIGLSVAYFAMNYFIRFREKTHFLETEQLRRQADSLALENKYIQVENAYLHNQISPHLLFNSLNFIFNQVRHLSSDAGTGVMMLSNLMQYALVTDKDNRTVILADEAEQINNLLMLSKMRHHNRCYIRFTKKGRLATTRIIPLILVTLVENMIKHGDLMDKKCRALVELRVENGRIFFRTQNKIRTNSPYPNGGLGLQNIRKRLLNTYGGNFDLSVLETETTFTLNLLIHEHDLLPGGR